MENLRIIKSFVILIGGMSLLILAIPLFVFAYDDTTTHPALTDEIVDHFNRYYSDKALSVAQKELVKLGSIEEDEGTKWLQHFYDPVHNRGLTVSGKQWESSKEWSQDTLAQATKNDTPGWNENAYGSLFSLFSSDSDFSWERAIYEYAWGDKNRAMLALGHSLHLLEDASVPDHTRNDPHPHITEWFSVLNESPYEIWTKKFTPNSFTASINASPVVLGSLNEYFDSMAGYSNGNFFSKDTIGGDDYIKPIYNSVDFEKLSDGQFYKFGYSDIDGDKYRLMLLGRRQFGSTYPINSLEDTDHLILTDYWSHLSKQAILHGAGAMKLFFDEVEKEKQTKTLYDKNRSWWQRMFDSFAGILFAVSDAPTVIKASPSPFFQKGLGETLATTDNETLALTAGVTTTGNEVPTKIVALSLVSSEPIAVPTQLSVIQNPPLIFLSGGAGPRRETNNQQLITDNEQPTTDNGEVSPLAGEETSPPTPPDTTPPAAPIITAPNTTLQTTADIIFFGTAESDAKITTDFNSATTTVAENNSWTLSLNLSQGTTTINFFAKDTAGNTSTGTAKTIFVDSEKPDIAFTIDECAASLSSGGCLVATTTLTLRWSSNANDLASYEISCATACAGFSYKNNATSTLFVGENNRTYTFTAKSQDIAGNESEAIQKIVEIQTSPVIINEIAWAGTQANEQDEWIELKNISNQAINLTNWRLYS